MSVKGPSISQLVKYYAQELPSSWLSHVSTPSDLNAVLLKAGRIGIKLDPIEEASQKISGENFEGAQEEDVVAQKDGSFRYSSRVVRWDDLHTEGEHGSMLSFGNHGSVLLRDDYQVSLENVDAGCSVIAAAAGEDNVGGVLVLPHILDMAEKRAHHLAQNGLSADASLFEVEKNDSVFHLKVPMAAIIGAQHCLYCLEIYKFIKGFAKLGIGMGKINAAFLFVDGTKSTETEYGTPPPLMQQFVGAADMLGIRLSRIRTLSSEKLLEQEPLIFDPSAAKLLQGEKDVVDLRGQHIVGTRKILKLATDFRDELPRLVRSRILRDRIWTYHVPMSIAVSNDSMPSLAGRFRSLRNAAKKYPKRAELEPWLVSSYARWQEELHEIRW